MQRFMTYWSTRASWLAIITLVVTGALAVPFLTMAPTETASTEPGGSVFDARDRIDEQFVSSVFPVFVIIEDPDGDLLRVEPLRALLAAENALRSELGPTLFSYFDPSTGVQVQGVITLADLVNDFLPGGLENATDDQVKAIGGQILESVGEDSSALGISRLSSMNAAGQWVVPAIAVPVLGDNNVLGFGNAGINLGSDTAPEEYAREIQRLLRTADTLDVHGVAIDVNLTSGEQGEAAGPFIGFTILAVLIIVGLTFRSYWILAVTGATLSALMIWLKGVSNLLGLKEDLVLTLIVPIAMISFGVDFAFHAVGRYREERLEGRAPQAALIGGLTAVSGALLLALTSDVVAFASNITSGIESIIQFGIGAAVALAAAYLLLGIATPIFVAAIEDRIGMPVPSRRSTIVRWLGSGFASSLAMAAVLLMVFVDPLMGVGLFVAYIVLAIVAPLVLVARGNSERTQETEPNGMDYFSTHLVPSWPYWPARGRWWSRWRSSLLQSRPISQCKSQRSSTSRTSSPATPTLCKASTWLMNTLVTVAEKQLSCMSRVRLTTPKLCKCWPARSMRFNEPTLYSTAARMDLFASTKACCPCLRPCSHRQPLRVQLLK